MIRWLAIVLGWCGLVSVAESQDRVMILPDGAVDPVVVVGLVEDFTGEELLVKRMGQTVPDRYPASNVQMVQTWRSPIHEQGLKEFEAGENAQAELSLQKALQDEPRDWMKREILAQLIRCAIRRGDWSLAGSLFLKITREDPTTQFWNVAPLQWAPQSMGDSQKTLARTWIKEADSPTRLLAASWLLLDPVYGETAQKQMDDLARDANRIIAPLARSQQWRMRLGQEISELEIQKWQRDVRRLPRSLRAGPQYLVARGQLQRNEQRAAVAELLWLSTAYTDHEELTARALVEAASVLGKSGQTGDAMTLYTLIIEKYAWSPWFSEAHAARSVLSSPADSGENTKR